MNFFDRWVFFMMFVQLYAANIGDRTFSPFAFVSVSLLAVLWIITGGEADE